MSASSLRSAAGSGPPPLFAESGPGPRPSLGDQIFLPFARALRIPALTRSRIRSRSSCATADTMVKRACPSGLLVSMFS